MSKTSNQDYCPMCNGLGIHTGNCPSCGGDGLRTSAERRRAERERAEQTTNSMQLDQLAHDVEFWKAQYNQMDANYISAVHGTR